MMCPSLWCCPSWRALESILDGWKKVSKHSFGLTMQGGLLIAKRISLAVLFLCAAFAAALHNADAQQTYEVIVQNGAVTKTRDGVRLFADIYRPRAEGK